MKKFILISIVFTSLALYFSLTVFILPEKYLSKEQFIPIPYFEAELSDSEILLGESFRLNIISENKGDYGDVHIVSMAFPNLQTIENVVEIVSYDFTHSPKFIVPDDEIGAGYSGGIKTIHAQYPSIEAMSRPIPPDSKYHVDLVITPQDIGPFLIYLKSIDIPHTSSISHFPKMGQLDHQEEYVLVYTVNVNP